MILSFFAVGVLLLFILLVAVVVILIAQQSNAGAVVALTLVGAVVSLIVLSLVWFVARPVQRNAMPQPVVAEAFPRVTEQAAPVVPEPHVVRELPVEPVAPVIPDTAVEPNFPVMPEPAAETASPVGPAPFVATSTDPQPPTLSGAAWDNVVEDTLQANVYSSATSAARALARECLADLSPRLAETPGSIQIFFDPSPNPQAVAVGTNLVAVFREAFPLAHVEQSVGPSTVAVNPLVITANLERQSSPTTETSLPLQVHGSVRLRGTCQDHTFDGVRQFIEKTWIHQFDEFVSSHPQRTFLRADCRSFADDEASAYNDAVTAAVEALLPRVITFFPERPYSVVTENVFRQRLRAAIESNEFVTDRFSQQLTGRSGNVWRAALLIESRPEQLAAIADVGRAATHEYHRSRRATELTFLLMVGLILVLYFVVNELTKGYFVWNLRTVTMLALLMMVVAFCWWVR